MPPRLHTGHRIVEDGEQQVERRGVADAAGGERALTPDGGSL